MKTLTKILVVGCLGVALSAQAALINMSTGVDANWKVRELPGGTAFTAIEAVAPDASGFPLISPYWLANDDTSKWVTISDPINNAPAPTKQYEYTLTFTATPAIQLSDVRWLSDNTSELFLRSGDSETFLGDNLLNGPLYSYNTWSDTVHLSLLPGTTYTLALRVTNLGQTGPNPTGARVEFLPVPEPATIAAGALLLLPFAASTLRRFRKS